MIWLSHNPDPVMQEGLLPFYIGVVECVDVFVSKRLEKVWQFTKVVKAWGGFTGRDVTDSVYATLRTAPFVGADDEPNAAYFKWRDARFADLVVRRYSGKNLLLFDVEASAARREIVCG